MADDEPEFNEDDLYDQFPAGAYDGYGPERGLQHVGAPQRRVAVHRGGARAIPAVRAFVDAPFAVTYAQFKSSHRETEYFIHKPHRAMTGQVGGIDGFVAALARRTGWHPSEISRISPTAAARELGCAASVWPAAGKRANRPPSRPHPARVRTSDAPGHLQRAPGTGRDPTRARSRSSHRPSTSILAAMPRGSGRGMPIASWSGSRATTLR